MKHSPEAYRNAPEEPLFTPKEKKVDDIQKRLRERLGLKDGDPVDLGDALRGLLTKEFISLALNSKTLDQAKQKRAETKSGLLNAAHAEAVGINEELDHLILGAEEAKATVEEAQVGYNNAVELLEKFQKEKLQ
jgi:hypothetical protein